VGLMGLKARPRWPTLLPGEAMLEVEERTAKVVSGMFCMRACPRDRMLPPAAFPKGTFVLEESDRKGVSLRTLVVDNVGMTFPAAGSADSPVRGEAAGGEAL